jgi:acetyl esterase
MSGTMIGRTYLWHPFVASGGKLTRGPAEPVVVVARWQANGPRNVALRRGDGSLVIRPFRGLRRP